MVAGSTVEEEQLVAPVRAYVRRLVANSLAPMAKREESMAAPAEREDCEAPLDVERGMDNAVDFCSTADAAPAVAEAAQLSHVLEDGAEWLEETNSDVAADGAAGDFQIRIVKRAGKKNSLGIDIDHHDGKTLQVEGIKDGLVDDWNKAAAGQDQVHVFDRIVSVNGMRGDAREMLVRCKNDDELDMIISRSKMNAEREKHAFDEVVRSILCGLKHLLLTSDHRVEHENAKRMLSKSIGEASEFCDLILRDPTHHHEKLCAIFGDDVRICYMQAIVECIQERNECTSDVFAGVLSRAAAVCNSVQSIVAELHVDVDLNAVRAGEQCELQRLIASWFDEAALDVAADGTAPLSDEDMDFCYTEDAARAARAAAEADGLAHYIQADGAEWLEEDVCGDFTVSPSSSLGSQGGRNAGTRILQRMQSAKDRVGHAFDKAGQAFDKAVDKVGNTWDASDELATKYTVQVENSVSKKASYVADKSLAVYRSVDSTAGICVENVGIFLGDNVVAPLESTAGKVRGCVDRGAAHVAYKAKAVSQAARAAQLKTDQLAAPVLGKASHAARIVQAKTGVVSRSAQAKVQSLSALSPLKAKRPAGQPGGA